MSCLPSGVDEPDSPRLARPAIPSTTPPERRRRGRKSGRGQAEDQGEEASGRGEEGEESEGDAESEDDGQEEGDEDDVGVNGGDMSDYLDSWERIRNDSFIQRIAQLCMNLHNYAGYDLHNYVPNHTVMQFSQHNLAYLSAMLCTSFCRIMYTIRKLHNYARKSSLHGHQKRLMAAVTTTWHQAQHHVSVESHWQVLDGGTFLNPIAVCGNKTVEDVGFVQLSLGRTIVQRAFASMPFSLRKPKS